MLEKFEGMLSSFKGGRSGVSAAAALVGSRVDFERMDRHWITTHDPHRPDDRWFVYLKDRTYHQGLPSEGDQILFYETGNEGPNGQPGRQALVSAAAVSGPRRNRVPAKGEWVYEIPCDEPEVAPTPVCRQDMLVVLNLPVTTPVMIFQGLKAIDAEAYAELRQRMGLPWRKPRGLIKPKQPGASP